MDQRRAGDWQRGFRADERQGPKAGGEACCQDECWDHSSANIMSAPVSPSRFSSLQEQPAIRVEHVVGLAAPERARHGLDRPLAAFDLDERADRRLVERDRGVLGRELLTELLVPEPDVETQRLEHARQHVAVADDGLVLFASLHAAGLHRAFERQQASAGFAAHPQCAALPAQRFVAGIEERIFLESPALEWGSAGSEDGRPRLAGGRRTAV